jgi:MFS family permease
MPNALLHLKTLRGEVATSIRVFGHVLAVRDLRLVLGAFTAFSLAEWANFLAILIYAYEVGGSVAVGWVSFLQLAPAALFAPFGATLGDRYRRESVLTVAYGLFGLSSVLVALALLVGWPVAAVYLLAAVNATVLTLIRPLHGSLLPALAGSSKELTAGYVAGGTIETIGLIVGPLIAGGLSVIWGPGAVFVATSVLLALGTVMVAGVRTRTAVLGVADQTTTGLVRQGLAALRHDARPRVLVVLLTSVVFVVGILDVALVVLAFEVFGTNEPGTALLNAAVGAGALVGGILTVLLIGRDRLGSAFRRGLVLSGLPVIAIVFVSSQASAIVALALAGIGMTFADVAGQTMLQRVVPVSMLSRVFGVLEGGYSAAEALGSAAGAILIATVGIDSAILVAGSLVPVVALLTNRAVKRADVGVVAPLEHIHLLRSLPIFAASGPADLERLASLLEREPVTSETQVVRQGEVGEHFYLIETGSATVVRDGKRIAKLAEGDFFGEIALVKNIPRTASVVADSEMSLLVLERGFFLDAVQRYPCQLATVEALSGARMNEGREPAEQ